jgi:hypothetical protein
MRKVMEPSFYYLYLLAIVLIGGFLIVQGIRKKNLFWILGIACVTLGLGDAFHLIPRAIGIYGETLDNPSESLAFSLGIGKLITSITMTVFYALLYLYFRKTAIFSKNKVLDILVCVLFFARIVLLCFPQNEWTTNGSPLDWGIYRNIPFTLLGAIFIVLCFIHLRGRRPYRLLYIAVTLSFLFYLPVVLFASMASWVGMLMLPKTVMYIWMIVMFKKA